MKGRVFGAIALLTTFFFLGCGGGGGGLDGGGTGKLSLSLTDAAVEGLKAVYVTIDKVQVHLGGNESRPANWKTVSDVGNGRTYNLLELVNGMRSDLGLTDLEAGRYTQMRLILGKTPDDGINILSRRHPFANYVITDTDEVHELKVPSGFQTGIKIVHGFTIAENGTTELVLDFDAARSVVRAGASGNWILKPTIKVFELLDYAIVRGVVKDGSGTPVAGVRVTAQSWDDNETPLDRTDDSLVVQAATVTDSEGEFALMLDPGPTGTLYNIVAYETGYLPGCTEVKAEPGLNQSEGTTAVLLVGSQPTGTLAGEVRISGAAEDQFVALSLRRALSCVDAEDSTKRNLSYGEVKSLNLLNGSSYELELTVGSYDAHIALYDDTSMLLREDDAYDVVINEDAETELNLPF